MNLKRILREDLGKRDLTTSSLGISNQKAKAIIIAKEEAILCGIDLAEEIFSLIGEAKIKKFYHDGDFIKKNKVVMEIRADVKTILGGERTALNFLMHLSGIATITNKMVNLAKPYGIKIYDTRKTLPGLREYEKYAVRMGGGYNHRMGLFDGILIKENHKYIYKKKYNKNAIIEMIKAIRENYPGKKITIEVDNLSELKQAIKAKADILMLDNWKIVNIKKALQYKNEKFEIEISGNINLDNIKNYLIPGIDRISVGMITHSAKAVDFSLYLV